MLLLVIKVSDVSKRFGQLEAVKNVSFEAENGMVTGLLGANGAGKSTTLRMLYGLLSPCTGKISVDGIDVHLDRIASQKIMGIMPDSHGLYPRLTAREHIEYFGRLHGMDETVLASQCEDLLRLLDMKTLEGRKVEGFSQGERTKVCLARALVHIPQNVVLDEPTNGLDVSTSRAVRDLISELRSRGVAVLFSSHLMHEVARICDHIVIVNSGRVIASGSVDQIKAVAGEDDLEEAFIRLAESDP